MRILKIKFSLTFLSVHWIESQFILDYHWVQIEIACIAKGIWKQASFGGGAIGGISESLSPFSSRLRRSLVDSAAKTLFRLRLQYRQLRRLISKRLK